MIQPTTWTYKTVGECAIKADVYRQGSGAGAQPALVYIHGGCLMYGSRQGINGQQLERYLGAGYTVISIDYRLSPESLLPEIIEDLRDAFRWVGEAGSGLFAVDPQRVAVVGHSAGGYLALMSGLCVAPRPRAIVAFYGYGDIIADWYSKPDPFYCQQPLVSEEESGCHLRGPVISEPYPGRGKDKLYLYCRQRGLWPLAVSGHDPASASQFFTPYCPAHNVTAACPPTLLLHGDRDTDVPYSQSVQMDGALSEQGVPHQLITLRGRGHGFDHAMEDPLVQDAFERTLAFLQRYLTPGGSR